MADIDKSQNRGTRRCFQEMAQRGPAPIPAGDMDRYSAEGSGSQAANLVSAATSTPCEDDIPPWDLPPEDLVMAHYHSIKGCFEGDILPELPFSPALRSSMEIAAVSHSPCSHLRTFAV